MIKLNNILREISEKQSNLLLNKIKNKEFKFYARGDNGKVYSINGEDLLLKITSEPDETAVADVIVGSYSEFNAFIPVIYSDSRRNPKLGSFIRALEQQINKTGIGDLDLSLDFKPDNIMIWQGNLVMIDW
mgnify:CR=1 FL=1